MKKIKNAKNAKSVIMKSHRCLVDEALRIGDLTYLAEWFWRKFVFESGKTRASAKALYNTFDSDFKKKLDRY
jgi:hypothetical protein